MIPKSLIIFGLFVCSGSASSQKSVVIEDEQTMQLQGDSDSNGLVMLAPSNKTVEMGTSSFVKIGLVFTGLLAKPHFDVNLTFALSDPNDSTFILKNESMYYTGKEIAANVTKSVYLDGIFIGINSIEVSIGYNMLYCVDDYNG